MSNGYQTDFSGPSFITQFLYYSITFSIFFVLYLFEQASKLLPNFTIDLFFISLLFVVITRITLRKSATTMKVKPQILTLVLTYLGVSIWFWIMSDMTTGRGYRIEASIKFEDLIPSSLSTIKWLISWLAYITSVVLVTGISVWSIYRNLLFLKMDCASPRFISRALHWLPEYLPLEKYYKSMSNSSDSFESSPASNDLSCAGK